MKNIILIFALIISFASTTFGQRDKITAVVEGLGCPFCAYGLEKKFKKVKGIKHVKILIEEGIFTFSVPVETALQLEEIESRVNIAGYTAKSIEIERANGELEKMNLEYAEVETNQDAEFPVWGICKMCKSRIENSTRKLEGVGAAKWDNKTKILKVSFDKNAIDIDKIKQALADRGHDTEEIKATEEMYNSLPACCLYDRKDIKAKTH